MQELLKQFADLDRQYKQIKEQRDRMRADITEKMVNLGIRSEETDWGTFTVSTRTTGWEFSDKIKTREENLKIAQEREKNKGIAQPKQVDTLVYTPVKDEQ